MFHATIIVSLVNAETKTLVASMKSAALAAREAAILADDGVAQREAEAEFNAAIAIESADRSRVAVKARISAESNAERKGWEDAEKGAGPEGELHVAKSLRACWRKGWEAYYAQAA